MTDRPILFSGPMVRAILDGRKTQTRRVLGTTGRNNIFKLGEWSDDYVLDPGNAAWRAAYAPYAPGDRLWVREAHMISAYGAHPNWKIEGVLYAADGAYEAASGEYIGNNSFGLRWRPSIHMPRWASRLTLIVTDVRVQRVRDISEADAWLEGIEQRADAHCRDDFHDLWDSLNVKRGYGWEQNPWVCAVTFTVHHGNIDALGPT